MSGTFFAKKVDKGRKKFAIPRTDPGMEVLLSPSRRAPTYDTTIMSRRNQRVIT